MTAAAFVRAVAFVAALAATVGCGGGDGPTAGAVETEPSPTTEFSPQPPAVAVNPGEGVDAARFQRLSVDALRLMIEAAQQALPIGPFQDRINAARLDARTDIASAADQLEAVVADLRAMLEGSRNEERL